MANHASAKKRIRANATRRTLNRYQAKTARTSLKKLHSEKDAKSAKETLPKMISMIDKLAKKKIIHKNKAAHLKSKAVRHVASLGK